MGVRMFLGCFRGSLGWCRRWGRGGLWELMEGLSIKDANWYYHANSYDNK